MPGLLDYSLSRTIAPTLEPIDRAAAKRQCTVDADETEFDKWFEIQEENLGVIQAAREFVESRAQIALMWQTWELKLDGWPTLEPVIDLHVHPVRSITTLAYRDGNGDSQTWSASNYTLERSKFRSRLWKANANTEWPLLSTELPRPITITFLAGYPTADDTDDTTKRSRVPAAAKQVMLMLIGHWFRNRESVLVGSISKEIEHGLTDLLNTIRPARYV